ncbi:MAG: arylsulfatase A-like enzyme [Planctomycetota bacterium]|jgi:arylsulfatase A-like enzyme
MLGLVSGCGSADEDAPQSELGRFERLELRPEDASLEKAVSRTLARFHFASALDPEILSEEQLSSGPANQAHTWEVPEDCDLRNMAGDPILVLPGEGVHQITLTTEVDPLKVSRLMLRGIFGKGAVVQVELLRQGKVQAKPGAVATLPSPEVQSLSIDLLRFRRVAEPYDSVRMTFTGKRPPARLFTLDLVDRPLEAWLPSTFDGAKLIPVANSAMRGVGVRDGAPLLTTFRVEQAGERLEFSVAEPPHLHAGKASKRFVAERLSGEELFAVTLTAPQRGANGKPAVEPGWSDAAIDLTPYVGQEISVRFRVEGLGKGRAGSRNLIALSVPELVRAGSEQRSVLLVTSDTHRADHLGVVWQGEGLETPALDALAARGVLFLDAFSSTNITQPSHTSLLTGLSPRDTRITSNSGHLQDKAYTLTEAFQDAGWATYGAVSVRHLGARGASLGQGFDRMVDPPGGPWPAEDPVSQMIEWMDAAEGRPVFAWVHIFDAHEPYAPPAEFDRRYYPKDKDPFDSSLPDPGLDIGRLPFGLLSVRDLEYPKAQYRAEISYLDSQLGRLFSLPRIQQAHVAFTSDHGEIQSGLGTWFNHGLPVPDTLHVPLILAGPDVPQVHAEGAVVHLDLGRTLLDLAGLGRVDFPGVNLLTTLDTKASDAATRFAMGSNGQHASITRGPWHMVLSLRDHQGFLPVARKKHEIELYDWRADPQLALNLLESQADLARELRAELVRWLDQAMPGGLSVLGATTSEALAELAALGYATDIEVSTDAAWIELDCGCEHCGRWR